MPCVNVMTSEERKRKGEIKRDPLDRPECNYSKGLKSEEDRAPADAEGKQREEMILGAYRVGHPDERPSA